MSRARALGAVVAAPLALAAVLGVEILRAANRTYLPGDPGFVIDSEVPGAGPPVRLAVLGDSTVAGVGSPTADTALVTLVAERVARLLDRPVTASGYGTSGARTAGVLAEQVHRLDDPDVVLVVIGSNDVTHLTPPWHLQLRTRSLLEGLRRRTEAPIVLGGIPRFKTVPALDQPLRWIVDRYAAVLRARQRAAVAQVPGTRFVDLATLASPRFLGRPEAMSSDGFHPSPVGYGFWADALAPAVAAAVTTRTPGAG